MGEQIDLRSDGVNSQLETINGTTRATLSTSRQLYHQVDALLSRLKLELFSYFNAEFDALRGAIDLLADSQPELVELVELVNQTQRSTEKFYRLSRDVGQYGPRRIIPYVQVRSKQKGYIWVHPDFEKYYSS